ncbi:MAG: tripartite tricarboxylate transporter TctB family protein [Rhizobiaceae bacterium]
MSKTPTEAIKFEGEEAGAGYASPMLDLIASGFVVALTVVVMIASWQLKVPGGLATAPGLLPFLTAASLFIMALALAATALKRHRAGVVAAADEVRDPAQDRRTLVLALTVAVYIACLQFLAFQYGFNIAGAHFILSAFEPVTIVALTVIMHISWRGPIWITVSISTAWTLILSLVFQKMFNIPLPGGF